MKKLTRFLLSLSKPLPLSGLLDSVKDAIKDYREHKSWDKVIDLIPYLVGGILLYILLLKGVIDVAEALEIIDKL